MYTLSAQSGTILAALDIQRAADGSAVIIGQVHSQSDKAQALSYSLQLKKIGPSGNVNSTQSGSFTLVPDERRSLSQVSINLGETASFQVDFKVFDDERVIANQQLKSDADFIKHFQQLQAQAPIPPVSNNTTTPKPNEKESIAVDVLEIDGLIIDETRSKNGRDFYDAFYNKWSAPKDARDFSITIKELPSRGRSARIAVEVNGNLLFQRFLQPRQDIIELLAEQTVNVIHSHLKKSEKLKSELESEDQQGSGIF